MASSLAHAPRYNNRRPCPVANYRWKSDNGIEIVGLPKTRAGGPLSTSRVAHTLPPYPLGAACGTMVTQTCTLQTSNYGRLSTPLPTSMQANYLLGLDVQSRPQTSGEWSRTCYALVITLKSRSPRWPTSLLFREISSKRSAQSWTVYLVRRQKTCSPTSFSTKVLWLFKTY